MKLVSFKRGADHGFGVIVGDGVVDLSKRTKFRSLFDVLKSDGLSQIVRAASGASPDVALSDIQLDLPMPDAPNYICVGRNYKGHVAEANAKLPDFPSMFLRLPNSLVASGQPIVRPKVSGDFDFEGELAVVIGKSGRHIPREAALSHVMGYTILMDGSIRDYQFKHCLIVGKNFFASGSVGPCIVTADEIGDPGQLDLSTRLNGVEVQHTRTDDFIFDIPYIINYVSTFTELQPGDVIATGTPEGVGFARKPPLWLKRGDRLEVEIAGIGVLTNIVVDE